MTDFATLPGLVIPVSPVPVPILPPLDGIPAFCERLVECPVFVIPATETVGLSLLALLFVCAAAVMLRSRRTPATP